MPASLFSMSRVLVIASIAWPLLLGADVWRRAEGHTAAGSIVLHAAASRICHRKPERSFHTRGVQWPVCARCSGLYLAAPVGAIAALVAGRRRLRRPIAVLAAASVPTALTLGVEWLRLADPGNLIRALAALPLGAAAAFLVVGAAGWGRNPIGYTDRP
jgi:uncharacterized membrane protein